MSRALENLRNIGIIAHIDAGKTTLTENMLFLSGAKHRVGEVDKGTTTTDSDAEEQERGITIYSACVTFSWRDVIINLVDTPGHVDFTAEVERSLRVLDGGVVVFSAREGVEAQSETVWRQADRYDVPRVAFINKMDREGANFDGTFKQIQQRLEATPVALQIPYGQGPAHALQPFSGVVDLITMKMLQFGDELGEPQVIQSEIPDSFQDEAEAWRELMLENLYHHSDELMERALAEEPMPEELLHRVVREATLARQIQPVLCGSALRGIGVQPVLDAVAKYLPSPADRPPVEGLRPGKDERVEQRKPDAGEPFCGLVFKILPAKTGDLYWVRVYSGSLKANSRVFNPSQEKKENVAQLWHIHAAKHQEQVKLAEAGDIVGVVGMRHSVTGDTICDAKAPILLESIQFPETVISMAIEPETVTERKKLSEMLQMLKRQDPTFQADENKETGQTLISGMGELHLEVIRHRLLRDFKLDVKVHKPRVNYRETIQKKVEVTGECHRMIGGQQLFAILTIQMQAHPEVTGKGRRSAASAGKNSGSIAVVNRCPLDAVPRPLLDAALDELEIRGQGGGLIGGFPLMGIRIAVTGAQVREEGSTEVAFRIAASDAFETGLREAGLMLLEPMMRLDITTPEDYVGDFIADLQQRRAEIVGTGTRGGRTHIEAHAPLAELFGYSSAMRSLSQGRAGCSIQPLSFAPAPAEVAENFM